MPMTKEQILEEARKLDQKELDELAQDIRQLAGPELMPDQMAEIHRRIEAADRGELRMYTIDQVIEELRERFRK
jgi:hypothetical protein